MKSAWIILWSICVLACNSELEDPAAIDASEHLQVSASRTAITAKNKTTSPKGETTRIFARLPKKAGVQDVSFSTTAGKFLESASDDVKQLADSVNGEYRYAPVTLRSDTTKGPVYVTAEVKSQRQRIIINFN